MSPLYRVVRFEMGDLGITAQADDQISRHEVIEALSRHLSGDWGDVGEDDWKANDFAMTRQLRLLSVYHTRSGTKFWIITEADRSYTTVLLPDDN